LRSEGVGTSFLARRVGATTAQSSVVVSALSGSRTIVTRPAPAPPEIPTGFEIVHVDKAGWAAMPAHGLSGSRISVDDGNMIPGLDVSLLAWYVPTAAVLRRRYDTTDAVEAARRAISHGANAVVATAGAAGSFAVHASGHLDFAPALPIRPLSTLGAGDVFHGAFVAALKLGQPLAEAIRFANVAAALSCRTLDGRSGIPGRKETLERLKTLPRSDGCDPSAVAALFAATDAD